MRILQIASGDFFSTYGGGQVYVKNIVDEMSRQRRDIAVISFVENIDGVNKKRYKNIDLYETGNISDSELENLIEAIASDIIHAHSHKALITKIGNMLNIPVIITAHHGGIVCPAGTLMDCNDHICDVQVSHKNCLKCVLRNTRTGLFWYPAMKLLPQKAYIRLGKWLQRLPFILFVTPIGSAALQIEKKKKEWKTIINGCSLMIAPCDRIAAAMERNGLDKSKVMILPHGIPLPDKVPVFPPVKNGNIRFFYTGRICYVKGIHILLEAFHRLDAPNAELHLIGGAGNKSEERYYRQLKNKYKSDTRIIWHGKIAPDQIYDTISQFHIGVSASICLEVFGLNIAESLAMGKPVLATMNGGAEMQIEDGVNGWLVPQNDIDAMQNKMQGIIEQLKYYDTTNLNSRVIDIKTHIAALSHYYETILNLRHIQQ